MLMLLMAIPFVAANMVGAFTTAFGNEWRGVDNLVKVIVRCGLCGQTWHYSRPRHYGGNAFRDQHCPYCGKTE